MLHGMERTLEKQLRESDRRRPQSTLCEDGEMHGATPLGFPEPLNPEVRRALKNLLSYRTPEKSLQYL
jgi:hypothetical protein